jgi:hypothetical protein
MLDMPGGIGARNPPFDLRTDRCGFASNRRRCPRNYGTRRGGCLRDTVRSRQRASNDCARYSAARDIWSSFIWRAYRPARRTGTHCPSVRAAAVWALTRRDGNVSHICIGGSLRLCAVRIAVPSRIFYQLSQGGICRCSNESTTPFGSQLSCWNSEINMATRFDLEETLRTDVWLVSSFDAEGRSLLPAL